MSKINQRRKNEETPVALTTEASEKFNLTENLSMKNIAQSTLTVKSPSLLDLIDQRDKLLIQADSMISLVNTNDNAENVSKEIITNTLWCVNDLLDELKSIHRLMDSSQVSLRAVS
jgi:hypothetical protein